MLVWPVPLAQVLPRPQLIFPFKTWFFWEFIWIFSSRKSFQNQYLAHSESKSYHIHSINPARQDLSNGIKGTFQCFRSFQLWFNLIFSEEIIQYWKTFAPQVQTPWNQAHASLLVESFPKRPRTWSEASWFDGSQTKLPSFIDRFDQLSPWVGGESYMQGKVKLSHAIWECPPTH